MKEVLFSLDNKNGILKLPEQVEVLSMARVVCIDNPSKAIQKSLDVPIDSKRLEDIIQEKGRSAGDLTACIVISDKSRPVPYKGDNGILWPIVERLLNSGLNPENIMVLVATGTHRGMTENELMGILDSRLWGNGIKIINHDCRNNQELSHLGKTSKGSDILINSHYVNSDVKILTGLVESHFMAGASGGPKSICPGLIGERSTFLFHGPRIMADEKATALVLDGNPCHQESLEMAKVAGTDFIVNVTLDKTFQLTGVFSGKMEKAHAKAVDYLRSYTAFRVNKKYDVVLTHAGFVGINHYQAAKAGVEAAKIVKPGGHVIMVADNRDSDAIGSHAYRALLHLLKIIGPQAFERMIFSPDWTFIPDQWEVQMWTRLFKIIPQDNFFYFSPQFTDEEYRMCPGNPMHDLADCRNKSPGEALTAGLEGLTRKLGKSVRELSIAYMCDGPYGIPFYE